MHVTISQSFVAWVFSLLVLGAPPDKKAPEDEASARARYWDIAESIAQASLEADRPIFTGRRPRSHSMALMTAVAVIESGLRADIDRGEKRGARGECTVFQLMPHTRGDCVAWLADRHLAASVAHELMARSRGACMRARGREEWLLAAYASGNCEDGRVESKARVDLALRWYRDHSPPTIAPWGPS